jgi:hypothetical protein
MYNLLCILHVGVGDAFFPFGSTNSDMRVEEVSEEIIELPLLEPYNIFFKMKTDQIFVSKKGVIPCQINEKKHGFSSN